MDSIIQKFYWGGKDGTQNYNHLGAFSSHMITNKNPISSLSHKTIADFKQKISTINPSIHNAYNTYKTLTTQRYPKMIKKEFLNPKKLVFNSCSDMLYHNPFRYNPRGELNLFKENVSYENKKNATKIQMIEEKMKNLELKNQRLEVINDFFFDMLENNLMKDEINRQRELKAEEENNNYYDESVSERNYFRKKHKKMHKSKSDVYLNKYNYKNNQFDALSFQEKTAQNARIILDNIKKNIGTYLVEEELKKNEQFQSINEGINELKSDLTNKLERIQKNQKQQMQKIAYCLLNSGDDNIEGLAMRLFNNDFSNINDIENIYGDKSYYKLKQDNYEKIEYNRTKDLESLVNSKRNSFGNNFRSNTSSKRNSLKKNKSQFELNRKPIVRFKEDL